MSQVPSRPTAGNSPWSVPVWERPSVGYQRAGEHMGVRPNDKNALIELIVSKIKEIPDYEKLKSDIELILVICKMIETISTDSDLKLDKLKTIIEVYTKSFEMSTDDHLNLVNVVNFLHQNRSFVYKRGFFKKAGKVLGWIASKALSIGINFIN